MTWFLPKVAQMHAEILGQCEKQHFHIKLLWLLFGLLFNLASGQPGPNCYISYIKGIQIEETA